MRTLSRESVIGEAVNWEEMSGQRFEGMLKEWDSNVAIVVVNGKEMAVEC